MQRPFLISYDIANPRRLARLHRALRKRAAAIQYSVFLGRFTEAGLAEVRAVISSIIDPAEDDVRIYPLPEGGWQRRLGRSSMPDGLLLTLLPPAFRGEPHQAPLVADRPVQPGDRAAPARPQPASIVRRVRTGQRRGIQLIS